MATPAATPDERRRDATGNYRIAVPLALASATRLYRDCTRTTSRGDADRHSTRICGSALVGISPAQPDRIAVEKSICCNTRAGRDGYSPAPLEEVESVMRVKYLVGNNFFWT